MAQTERRQARIRRIREQNSGKTTVIDEKVAINPDVHYAIGQSENLPEHIGLFVQKHQGDPAIKVVHWKFYFSVYFFVDDFDRISFEN
jgi:hypothetical protein